MGKPQFSTELADFNQAQIDAIETAVDEVGVAVQQIETLVNEVKNTDLANVVEVVQESAYALGDLIRVGNGWTIVTEATNVIVDITGSGYLRALGGTDSSTVTIVVDNSPNVIVIPINPANTLLPFVVRFNTSIRIRKTASAARVDAIYTLD